MNEGEEKKLKGWSRRISRGRENERRSDEKMVLECPMQGR